MRIKLILVFKIKLVSDMYKYCKRRRFKLSSQYSSTLEKSLPNFKKSNSNYDQFLMSKCSQKCIHAKSTFKKLIYGNQHITNQFSEIL